MTRTANDDRESIAKPPTRHASHRGRRTAITGFGALLLIFLGLAVWFYFNLKTVVVSGRSMFPTFVNGQRVLVSKAYWLIGPVRNKDVVVLREDGPTGYIIKRVAYMAGESVNWKDAPDSYQLESGRNFVVPAGYIYVLGDNRPESSDSREFGPVPVKDILGKVVVFP